MHNNLRKILGLVLIAGTVGLSTGCATQAGVTKQQMSSLQARIDRLAKQVNKNTADAQNAKQVANQASDTASQALDKANSAASCCNANQQKLDRMFHNRQTK